MIFQFFCSLFVVTRYDVDGCLNLGPSVIGYHVHLVEHSTRVGVLLFAVLHRADESQPARNSCPRLPHSVDSRFGLYHVAVVLSFLRSPALHKFNSNKEVGSKEVVLAFELKYVSGSFLPWAIWEI